MYKHTQVFRLLNRTGRYLNQYLPYTILHPHKWFWTKMLIICSPSHFDLKSCLYFSYAIFHLISLLYFLFSTFSTTNYFFYLLHSPCLSCLLGLWSLVLVLYVSVLHLFQDKPSSLFSNTVLQLLFVKMLFHWAQRRGGKGLIMHLFLVMPPFKLILA